MSFEDRSALGIYSADERQRYLETGSYEQLGNGTTAAELVQKPAPERKAAPVAEPVDAEVEEEAEVVEEAPKATAHTTAELLESISGMAIDSPLCFTCGTKMRPAGSCYVCEGCGSTSGCS